MNASCRIESMDELSINVGTSVGVNDLVSLPSLPCLICMRLGAAPPSPTHPPLYYDERSRREKSLEEEEDWYNDVEKEMKIESPLKLPLS